MSKEEIELDKSYWWSRRQEFGQGVLCAKRKALALSQGEMSRRTGISQSRISRIETGGRTDDPVIAQKISEGYLLDKTETELWFHLCFGTPTTYDTANLDSSTSLSEIAGLSDSLLESYRVHVDTVKQVRLSGNPQLAIQVVITLSEQVERVIKANICEKERPALLKILAELYNEQGWAYSELSSRQNVWVHETGFVNQLRRIEQQYGDNAFSTLAHRFLGDAYYIAGQYDLAIRYLHRAVAMIQDPLDRMGVLLALAKIWGRQGEEKRFKATYTEIFQLIDSGRVSDLRNISVINGNLASSQARLGMHDAFKTLETAKNVLAKMRIEQQISPISEIQVVRDELEVFRLLEPEGQHHHLEKPGKDAISLAIQSKIFRLANRIEELLTEMIG